MIKLGGRGSRQGRAGHFGGRRAHIIACTHGAGDGPIPLTCVEINVAGRRCIASPRLAIAGSNIQLRGRRHRSLPAFVSVPTIPPLALPPGYLVRRSDRYDRRALPQTIDLISLLLQRIDNDMDMPMQCNRRYDSPVRRHLPTLLPGHGASKSLLDLAS